MKITASMVIIQRLRRIKGFLKRHICPFDKSQETLIAYKYRSFEKDGGDILPGPIEVPTSDTLYCHVYNTDKGQYLVTCTKTHFFFFIPYTYDEFIIHVNNRGSNRYNIDTITAEDFLKEIDEAHNWNKTGRRQYIEGYEYVNFCDESGSLIDEAYEIGNNDYKYLQYTDL